MAMTKPQPQLKAQPKGKRPRCKNCKSELTPLFKTTPMPTRLADGRRRAEREEWEKANPPRFTGNYGRLGDNHFCGTSCGYRFALKRISK